MARDDDKSHPAYLAALSFAGAQCDVRSNWDGPEVVSREQAQVAMDIRKAIDLEYEKAHAMCVAAGWRFTPSHVCLGRVEHMPPAPERSARKN